MHQCQGVSMVPLGRTVVIAQIVVVVEIVASLRVGDSLRPGIGEQEIQTMRNLLLELCLQAVVVGIVAVADVVDRLLEAIGGEERPP